MTTQKIATALSVVLALVLLNNGCGKKEEQPQPGKGSSHAEESGVEDKGKVSRNTAAKAENDNGNKTKEMNENMADYVLVYLGYKNGNSLITRLCGRNLKDAGAMPPGVSLDSGTGIMTSFCNEKVVVRGKAGGTMQVLFQAGATVELDDDQVWIYGETGWSPRSAPVSGVKHQSPSTSHLSKGQVASIAQPSGKTEDFIPNLFIGIWERASEDGTLTNRISISADQISWEQTGQGTHNFGSSKVTVSEDKQKLTFQSGVTVAKGTFFPSPHIDLKRTVSLKRDGDELIAELSAAREKTDASGLMSWKAGTTISREVVDGKIVTYVEYPAEIHKYKKVK